MTGKLCDWPRPPHMAAPDSPGEMAVSGLFHVKWSLHRCQHYRFRAQTHAFLAPSRIPAFHLKCPAFFLAFPVGKNALYVLCSASSRLGNQLPVLGKANSLCKIVKFCVFWPVCFAFIPGYRSSGNIGVAPRLCTTVTVVVENIQIYAFSSALSRFFVRWCW